MTDYAEVPYESLPVPESHPEHLEALGWLFGLDPADHRCSRVLELGCANGGNIIPMAAYLPEARFVGVDLYANQIADGTAVVEAADLRNIVLLQGDIAALDARELGVFDYVICHGVYSWVPDDVRAKILHLCTAVLGPQGLAYVSYNTLPGWRMRGVLRDMLRHVTRNARSTGERVRAMHAFFDRMEQALSGLDALSARYLATEIRRLRGRPVGYLVHEFLEPENRALLFTEFVAAAAEAALAYVCDTDLSTRYPELIGTETAAALDAVRDPREREQYVDFVVNRNFRRSLLCHSDAHPSAEPRFERLEEMQFATNLVPPRKLDLRKARAAPFARRDGSSMEVTHPLTKAAIARLGACWPQSMGYRDLLTAAGQDVRTSGGSDLAGQAAHLLPEIYGLVVRGAVELLRRPRYEASPAPARPETTALARAQLDRDRPELATRQHTVLAPDAFAARLLSCLDGVSSVEEVVELLVGDVRDGRIRVEGVLPERVDERARAQISGNVRRLVARFASAGLLKA